MFASLTMALVMTQSALKIEDVKLGTGEAVKLYDIVEAEYTGSLVNGKVFDSNVGKNAPFHFQVGVGKVISGWDQGFIGMKMGGERKLVIPPELGYGDHDMGEAIPKNSTLKFSVKLLKVLPSAKITIEKPGTGDPIKLTQFIECKISVKTSVGKELMVDPNKAARLQLSRDVWPWINQALGGIKVGEKRKVVVNYASAFGDKGYPPVDQDGQKAGSQVPPKSDLTIEIEALKISN